MTYETPLRLGTLSDGRDVFYEPGGVVHETEEWHTSLGVTLERPVKHEEEFVYLLARGDTEDERITVSPSAWGKPERTPSEMCAHLGEEHGWENVTAEALVLAYGTERRTSEYPDTASGKHLVGLSSEVIFNGLGHGDIVALYVDEDRESVTPHIQKDGEMVRLPDSELTKKYTYDLSDFDGIGGFVSELEERDEWHIYGYPYDLTENKKVSGQDVQVHHEFESHLDYPTFYREGGRKHRIR